MSNYLVIGASTGIGAALTQKLSEEGHQVWGTFRQHPPQPMTGVQFHYLDVMADQYDLSFLPDVLHGIAYCPGTIQLRPFHRTPAADFIHDYTLQVVGAVRILQQVQPLLKAGAPASVVLFSTVAVQTGFTFHTQVAASKGAIEGLTRALAAEWAPNIRVNCIAPSITDTPLASQLLSTPEKKEAHAQRHPLKKIGTPDDLAAAAAFLLGADSRWITGQIWHIDGGMAHLKI